MNLANKITIIRMFMVPIFLFFLLIDMDYSNYIATAIFILAASTDGLDGYIARKRNEITNFGKFMDPLADKLLITSALVGLVEIGKVSSVVAIIIISRELVITGFRVLAASEGINIAASWWGKIKTVSQIVAVVAILLGNYPLSLITSFPFDKASLYFSVYATIISGFDYIYKNRVVLGFGQ